MGLIIEDGTGHGNKAEVTDKNSLRVYAINIEDGANVSYEDELTFSITSTCSSGGTDVEVLYIKNIDQSRNFIIRHVTVSSSVATLFQLFGAMTGTVAGTSVTPTNMNLGSSISALLTCYGNNPVTGLTPTKAIANAWTSANSTYIIDFRGGLVMSYNTEIVMTASANGTIAVTIIGYFKDQE